jgi:hypothetical protein
VLLLENVCARGEVDASLQMEITQECSNFGNVVRCLVHEVGCCLLLLLLQSLHSLITKITQTKQITDRPIPDDKAVRVFVKFRSSEQAETAQRELDHRFFGGREIHCRFFDEQLYDKRQLN